MPRWAALVWAAWKMAALASTTAATTTSTLAAPPARRSRSVLGGDGAGHLTGLVAAHAVGDGEHHRFGDEGVLVVAADAAGVGGGAPAGAAGHHGTLQARWADLEAVAHGERLHAARGGRR